MSRTKKLALVALAALLAVGGVTAAAATPEHATLQAGHDFACC
ncbi:hypothetical protein P5P86_04680 [Nocardioides sp. BP30]|nr:hypothetical protein [Nocardioides sp. BP30]WGL53119.1 hypothetical protein P5P86_04680 [Nocardioides sp. BP30]